MPCKSENSDANMLKKPFVAPKFLRVVGLPFQDDNVVGWDRQVLQSAIVLIFMITADSGLVALLAPRIGNTVLRCDQVRS